MEMVNPMQAFTLGALFVRIRHVNVSSIYIDNSHTYGIQIIHVCQSLNTNLPCLDSCKSFDDKIIYNECRKWRFPRTYWRYHPTHISHKVVYAKSYDFCMTADLGNGIRNAVIKYSRGGSGIQGEKCVRMSMELQQTESL